MLFKRCPECFSGRSKANIVDPWKFDVLKTNIWWRSKASRANMFVEYQISKRQLSNQ